jgi:NADH pyrophosphatase NudC (nudix superfamily)
MHSVYSNGMTQQVFWNSTPPKEDKTPCYVFYGDHLLAPKDLAVERQLCWKTVKTWDNLPTQAAWQLYTHQGEMVYLINLSEQYEPNDKAGEDLDGWTLQPLKPLYKTCDAKEAAQLSQAYQLLHFNRTHQYCGSCAKPLGNVPHEWAKRCPDCDHIYYPRLSPVVMVLIHREDKILLARHRIPQTDFYSALAGFVEPGETLEQTAAREVQEEVGLQITNLRYFGSQSWPFPHSVIAAFHADYTSGEIKVDGEEIAHADWFDRASLPLLPPTASIARQLIDSR